MTFLAGLLSLLMALPAQAGFFQFLYPVSAITPAVVWPTGVDGSQHILTGQTLTLTPGQTYNYQDLTVDAGGIVECALGTGWAVLGVVGTLTNNGTIRCTQFDNGGSDITVTASPSDLQPLSFTYAQAAGGTTGWGSQAYGNGAAGASVTGSCDCGGACSDTPPSTTAGGTSYRTSFEVSPGQCIIAGSAAGASTFGGAGANGGKGNIGGSPAGPPYYSSGGGGGMRNYSGGPLYIHAGTVAGNGVFQVTGSDGGAGGDATDFWCNEGYAGAGGAGGGGGKLLFRVDTSYTFSGTITKNPGSGGLGGREGACGRGSRAASGSDGQAGSCQKIVGGVLTNC